MSIYADTSVLFSLYVTDANSPGPMPGGRQIPFPLVSLLAATEFCTFDTRQGKLAKATGLHVQP